MRPDFQSTFSANKRVRFVSSDLRIHHQGKPAHTKGKGGPPKLPAFWTTTKLYPNKINCNATKNCNGEPRNQNDGAFVD